MRLRNAYANANDDDNAIFFSSANDHALFIIIISSPRTSSSCIGQISVKSDNNFGDDNLMHAHL